MTYFFYTLSNAINLACPTVSSSLSELTKRMQLGVGISSVYYSRTPIGTYFLIHFENDGSFFIW